jgi:hypothetical protein
VNKAFEDNARLHEMLAGLSGKIVTLSLAASPMGEKVALGAKTGKPSSRGIGRRAAEGEPGGYLAVCIKQANQREMYHLSKPWGGVRFAGCKTRGWVGKVRLAVVVPQRFFVNDALLRGTPCYICQ